MGTAAGPAPGAQPDPAGPDGPDGPATAEETVEAVIRRRLSDALGGWYGSLETTLPTVAFVVLWLVRGELQPALLAAAAVTLVLLGIRMRIGGSMRYVLSSMVATAIAAFFALRSGKAEDAFLPGILTSAGYGVAVLVSILARWPVIGFLVATGDPDYLKNPAGWHRNRSLVRVCSRLTWVLVGLFAVRVAVMVPLYLAGEVAWLGVAKIALGWPLYLVAVLVMGLILTMGKTPQTTPPTPTGTTRPGPPTS